jgi:nanoRNase/pAp phosphatase (c-di-AMP/oligoRNAs hydrolase)
MEIPNSQNFFDLLQKSQTALIALPKQPRKDAVGSAMALASFLRKLDKEVLVVCDDAPLASVELIPGAESIQASPNTSRAFVISVNTEKSKLAELSYHTTPDHVEIRLQPEGDGSFSNADVSFSEQHATFDMVICVDTPSLEHLGKVYTEHAALFLDAPKVNIDNHISNESYGTINIIEVTAAATSEIVFELLKRYESNLIDAPIATALLAGIISETNSFQKPATTHNSFLRASELIGYGADQQNIVRHLFKTRSFSMLKLWGRAMARMKTLPQFTNTAVYFSVVTAQDLERSGANESDMHQAFHELVANLPDLKVMLFVIETTPLLTVFIYVHPNLKITDIANEFAATITSESMAESHLAIPIAEAEDSISKTLEQLKNRIGL